MNVNGGSAGAPAEAFTENAGQGAYAASNPGVA